MSLAGNWSERDESLPNHSSASFNLRHRMAHRDACVKVGRPVVGMLSDGMRLHLAD